MAIHAGSCYFDGIEFTLERGIGALVDRAPDDPLLALQPRIAKALAGGG